MVSHVCRRHGRCTVLFVVVLIMCLVWSDFISANSLKVSFTTLEASCGEREIGTCKLFGTFIATLIWGCHTRRQCHWIQETAGKGRSREGLGSEDLSDAYPHEFPRMLRKLPAQPWR